MDVAWQVVAGLLPPIGVGLVFWFVMRAVIHADRRERQAVARLAAQERPGPGPDGESSAGPADR